MIRSHDTRYSTARSFTQLSIGVSILLILFPAAVLAGQWRVAPVRVFLDREAKSSVVTVVNEGEEKVNLQCKAMEWSQDAQGKDDYQETNDLIFFPRILMLEKGEQKIIRAGIKMPATAREKTYRLFIEEIPQPKKSTADSTQLTVAVRFGVPFFVRPLKEELAGELSATGVTKGNVNLTVKNNGNSHFRIIEILIKGKDGKGEEAIASKLDGWYLLAGASRLYSAAIPVGKCDVTKEIDITVTTDSKVILNRHLNVEKGQCLP